VSHTAPQSHYLSLRLSEKLAADLRRVANTESNTASAVARRLLSVGLSRELREAERRAAEQEIGR
jgi:hypothetical protein